MKTYIIGDVHGEFDILMALVGKLPKDAKLIFVGDLIDRGVKSKEVVAFVRKNDHKVVLGNHEDMMITYGESFLQTYPKHTNPSFLHTWYNNGGRETLLSYGLIGIDKHDGKMFCIENQEALKQFKSDMAWMKTLPLYIKIPNIKKNGKDIVVSHASMADVWHFCDNIDGEDTFREYALWNRKPPRKDVDIYNIYGHTIVDRVDTSLHYLNVDTGCFKKDEIIRELSAYCIEDDKVVSQRRIR